MRFQLLAARAAFAALVLGVLLAVAAVAGVRLGFLSDAAGGNLMVPATGLGLAGPGPGAGLAVVGALSRNLGDGKRLGLFALLGALAFLYAPLSYVYYGLVALPIHDATTDPENPPQFVALAKVPAANSRVLTAAAASPIRDRTPAIAAPRSRWPMPCTTNIRP